MTKCGTCGYDGNKLERKLTWQKLRKDKEIYELRLQVEWLENLKLRWFTGILFFLIGYFVLLAPSIELWPY